MELESQLAAKREERDAAALKCVRCDGLEAEALTARADLTELAQGSCTRAHNPTFAIFHRSGLAADDGRCLRSVGR